MNWDCLNGYMPKPLACINIEIGMHILKCEKISTCRYLINRLFRQWVLPEYNKMFKIYMSVKSMYGQCFRPLKSRDQGPAVQSCLA